MTAADGTPARETAQGPGRSPAGEAAGKAAQEARQSSPGEAAGEQAQDRERQEAAPAPEDLLAPETALEVDPLIDDPGTRIIVCCGAGGVGKTTTAAALGVRAAERGRRAVVLTIDPARRLAQSMGLGELDNTPRKVPGVDESAGGELHAMMLDMKRTFDEIVEAHADPERARAILGNPFYQSLSAGFAGTQEYMAMEKLGQLRARDEWDLIIVDTPPSRSALDFLDAPKRLGSFLDGKFIKMLMAPAKVGGKAGMKFVNLGMAGLSVFTGALNKLLGAGLLRDVQTFVAALDTMFGGFRTRADATYRLLQAPGTAFLVVAAPERDALREAAYFVERLAADRMPLAGLVLNRMHGSGAARLSAERALAAAENLEESGIVDHGDGKGEEHDVPSGPLSRATTRPAGSSAASPGQAAPAGHEGDGNDSPRSGARAAGGPGRPSVQTAETAEAEHPTRSTAPVTAHAAARSAGAEEHDGAASAAPRRLAAGLLRLHAERMQLLARERRTRDRFVALHPEVPVVEVAALPSDVHDLEGLRAVGARLAGRHPAA